MATDNFHARLQRIQAAQENAPSAKSVSFRSPGIAGVAAVHTARRRRHHPLRDHLVVTIIGMLLGCLVAVGLIGLSAEGAPWGPGTEFHDLAYFPIMGGLGLAGVLMVLSVFLAARRPGFALFSLGYLSGIVVPLFI